MAAVQVASSNSDQQPGAVQPNMYWGPWQRCLTGYATDTEYRHQGASGGVLSALAAHALANGQAEQVVHIGSDPLHPTRNITLVSTTPAQVLAGAGSRYAVSSPLAEINALLDAGPPLSLLASLAMCRPCGIWHDLMHGLIRFFRSNCRSFAADCPAMMERT